MNVTLDPPPPAYSQQYLADLVRRLETAFGPVLAKGIVNYLGTGKLVLPDEDDGSLQEIYVASGAVLARPA